MNDDQLVDLLLANYTEQYALYRSLLDNLHAGIPAQGSPPDMPRIIGVLEQRSRVFERIREIDERIRNNKIGWDRRKHEIRTATAETLKTLLTQIRDILGRVMEANARLESLIQQAAPKDPS